MLTKPTIPPVIKSVRVKASQEHAFEVFTAGLDRWWPRKTFGPAGLRRTTLEAGVGGRWFEIGTDGSEVTVGRVLAWEPPHRLVVTWEVSCRWEMQPGGKSEVEVTFTAVGPNETLVELTHRNFENMGDVGGKIRSDVDDGWPGILELYQAEAERNASGPA